MKRWKVIRRKKRLKIQNENKLYCFYDNHGLTLVELLVVLAIMAVLIGGAVVGVNILTSGDAKKASKNIDNVLSEVRTSTLSVAGSWEAKLAKEDGSISISVIKNGTVIKTEKLGKRITIEYQDMEGSRIELKESEIFRFSYATSSGKFKFITDINGNSLKKDDSQYGRIIIKGNSTEYSLKLWYDTGRITVDN